MAKIEADFGLRSTWFFRWRTADPEVIRRLRTQGFAVGFHYETLTRRMINRAGTTIDAATLASCRIELDGEIERFIRLFGPIKSVVSPRRHARAGSS